MRLAWCALFLLAACRQSGVHSGDGQPLRATPASVSIHAWVGYPASQTVTVFNPNRASAQVTAQAAAPFSVTPLSFQLQGGASLDLDVTLLATSPGTVTGTLDLGSVKVPLDAHADAAPDCGTAADCQAVAFEPDAGVCVTRALDDGTGCASPYNCFTAAECRNGQCRGTTTNCGDDDPCTLDVCGATGCGHIDDVTSCPTSPNPCLAPVCDRDAGCGFAPVPDGLACGARDCTSAQICVSAQCVSRAVPQNQACVDVVAGVPSGKGTTDGVGRVARFTETTAMTYDPAGNLYVADGYAIRKVAPNGTVTTLAGSIRDSGAADGFGPNARFSALHTLLWFNGQLLAADGCALRQVSAFGVVSTWVGKANDCRALDGIGTTARLNGGPVALTASGHLALVDGQDGFLADAGIPLRQVSAIGEVLTLGTLDFSPMFTGVEQNGFLHALVETPRGLTGCATIQNLPIGQSTPCWFDLAGDGGLHLDRSQHYCDANLAFDGTGVLFGDLSQVERRLADGGFEVVAGEFISGSRDGPASTARFNSVMGVAVGPAGEVASSDFQNANIRLLSSGLVSTLAGPIPDRAYVDGPGADARFSYPWKVVAGTQADAYLIDNGVIRAVDAAGTVSTLAGAPGCAFTRDGTGAQACFYSPLALWLDAPDTLLVGDARLRYVTVPAAVTTSGPRYADVIFALARSGGELGFAVQGRAYLFGADGGGTLLSPPGSALYTLESTPGGFLTSQGCDLFMLSLDGGWAPVTAQAGCGSLDGPLSTAMFGYPIDVRTDGTTIYPVETSSNRLRRIRNGQVDTVIDLSDAPSALAIEDGGTLLVLVDSAVLRVRP